MTRPDWASEAEWEKAYLRAGQVVVLFPRPFANVEQTSAAISSIARALVHAKNEGKREAAEIASPNHGGGVFNDYERGRRDAAQAIHSSIQKEPT